MWDDIDYPGGPDLPGDDFVGFEDRDARDASREEAFRAILRGRDERA